MVNLAGRSLTTDGMHIHVIFEQCVICAALHAHRADDCAWTAGIMERSDEQILPSLYSRVGAAFDATPSQLGWITLARAVVQAVASPIGGIAGFKLNRVWVISFGCLLWGVMTVGLDPTGPSVSCSCSVSYCQYHAQHGLTNTSSDESDSCMLMQACFAGTHSVATGAMFWGVNGIGLSLVGLQRRIAHNVLAQVVTLCQWQASAELSCPCL